MKLGVYVAPFGPLADAEALAAVAARAEAAGWDALFVWDHVMTDEGVDVADPWIALAAVAVATERLRLGPLVTPLARWRPWDVARQAATLDRLSGGRAVLGVGLGGDERRELSAFGEEREPRARAALLDEALEVVTALWTGEPVTHAGPGWILDRAQILPTPAQAPRPPIWAACVWPNRAPLRRAARLDASGSRRTGRCAARTSARCSPSSPSTGRRTPGVRRRPDLGGAAGRRAPGRARVRRRHVVAAGLRGPPGPRRG